MRRQLSLKSNTYTESVGVNAAGISGKERAHYPGRSDKPPERRLSLLQSNGKGCQKSAEAIVASRSDVKG